MNLIIASFYIFKSKKRHIQCSQWIYPSRRGLSAQNDLQLCVWQKTEVNVVCCKHFIVHIRLELWTIILHQDNTSVKISSLIGVGLDGVPMTLKWNLKSTYSAHGVSVHALPITLTIFGRLGWDFLWKLDKFCCDDSMLFLGWFWCFSLKRSAT